jgi:hypothetical protein
MNLFCLLYCFIHKNFCQTRSSTVYFSNSNIVAVGTFSTSTIIQQSAQVYIDPISNLREPKAPMAASEDGNNVYVV